MYQKPHPSDYPAQLQSLAPTELAQLLDELTRQERRILYYAIAEWSCKEIANQLNVSTETVKKHRKNIIRKLGIKGKVQFRRLALHLNSYTPKIPPSYPLGGIDTP